jgi:hypothetical protein
MAGVGSPELKPETAPSGIWARYVKPTLDVIQALGVLLTFGAVIVAIGQLQATNKQMQAATLKESTDLGLKFDDRLSDPQLVAIIEKAQQSPSPTILAQNGGEANVNSLQKLFIYYDTLYFLVDDNLMDTRTANDLFCSDLLAVHRNQEISEYLADERLITKSPTTFDGFDKMNDLCAKLQAAPPPAASA